MWVNNTQYHLLLNVCLEGMLLYVKKLYTTAGVFIAHIHTLNKKPVSLQTPKTTCRRSVIISATLKAFLNDCVLKRLQI